MTEKAEVQSWAEELQRVSERIEPRFGRRELRLHAQRYLQGLLSSVDRKNGWQLAEELGELTPTNLQHFIARSRWDAELVRDDLQAYVAEHLHAADGVLIVDETGFLKKGVKSVGVQRQYTGTAGKIENCQVGVFLAYQSCRGKALIDRALYLPQSWTQDPERCREAKVPEPVRFATKPALAQELLQRSFASGLQAAWITADEVYGNHAEFREFCEQHQKGYVLAISSKSCFCFEGQSHCVGEYVKHLDWRAWQRLACGAGSKGPRNYDWHLLRWAHPDQPGYERGLLIRRSLQHPEGYAYYYFYAPEGTSAEELVRIAGSRWAIEECFEQAKQETGLAHYEVRSWLGWYRHITLSMLAHATLSVIRLQAREGSKKSLWT